MNNKNLICLRKIEEKDTEDIIRWRNSDWVKKKFIYQKNLTVHEHNEWIKSQINTGKSVQFIIYHTRDNKSIGTIYLRDIDYVNDKAEFGIFIGEEVYSGHGYGSRAAEQIIAYGFNELKLNKIFLRVFNDNISAIKMYESVGFKEEGIFRQDVKVNGQYRDIKFMSIINRK